MTCSEGFVRVPGPVLRVLGTDTSCVGDWTLSRPSTLPIMFRAGVPCCVCSQEALPSSIPVERRLCAPIRCRGTASPRIATRRGGFAGPSTDQVPGFRADVFMGSHRNAEITAGWTDAKGGLSGFDGDMGGLPQSFPLIRPHHSCRCLAVGCRPVRVMAPAVASRCSPGLGGMSQGWPGFWLTSKP